MDSGGCRCWGLMLGFEITFEFSTAWMCALRERIDAWTDYDGDDEDYGNGICVCLCFYRSSIPSVSLRFARSSILLTS